MIYEDALNDYGNAETITASTIYGGWSGNVSGTWTVAGNPYVVTGDIFVQNGESLTIESGVEVRFYGNFPFYIYGSLIAEGTEGDSIYFMNHVDDGISNWRGLRLYGYDIPEQYTMSYVSIEWDR